MKLNQKTIYFFDEGTYLRNEVYSSYRMSVFCSTYCGQWYEDYIIHYGTIDIQKYNNCFLDNIDNLKTFYFDKDSKFPRNKLQLSQYKRCVKLDKADATVIDNAAKFIKFPKEFEIFYAPDIYYAITKDDFDKYFDSDIALMCSRCHENINIQERVYSGLIFAYNKDHIYKWLSGEYNKPFILDETLNKTVSKNLPDLTFEEAMSMSEMLCGKDSSAIQMTLKILNGYNIYKYRLSCRLLLSVSSYWFAFKDVATKSVAISLDLRPRWISTWYIRSCWRQVQEAGVEYEDVDIQLAKKLAMNIPTVKETLDIYSKDKHNNIINDWYTFDWIPDEYKK